MEGRKEQQKAIILEIPMERLRENDAGEGARATSLRPAGNTHICCADVGHAVHAGESGWAMPSDACFPSELAHPNRSRSRSDEGGAPAAKIHICEAEVGHQHQHPATHPSSDPTLRPRSARAQDGAPQTQQCAAVRGDGRQCVFPAKEGFDKCERHQRWYASVPPMLGMPYPEDAISLQEVMAQTVAMVLNRELEADKALAVQKLCQTMEKNLLEFKREVADAEADLAMAPRIRRVQ